MKKTVLSILLIMSLLFSLLSICALAADEWSVSWELSSKGELTVKGYGALPDHWVTNESRNSWQSRRADLKSAVVESGFSALGAGVFADCPNLTAVTIPATVTKLGAGAFQNSPKIAEVTYGGTEAAWNAAVQDGVDLPAAAEIHFQGQPAPTPEPTTAPTAQPTVQPTAQPTVQPTVQPTAQPTAQPTTQPSAKPGEWSVSWNLSRDGELVVSGSGQIPDGWAENDSHSWKNYWSRVRSVVIQEGFASLGSGTLSHMPSLATVTIPASVTVLSRSLFVGSTAVQDVYYGGTEAAWKAAGGDQVDLPAGAKVHFAGSPAPVSPFVDVPADAYYASAVNWAVARMITVGTDNTHFSPDLACTRAQVVTFLWRAMGSPEPTGTNNPFVDVKADDYFCKAVLWAVQSGVTAGMDATHFGPDADCTRAQVVTFLWRVEGKPAASAASAFVDVSSDAYFAPAVAWAVSNAVTAGTDAAHFSPDLACTRAQIVTFLWRDLK